MDTFWGHVLWSAYEIVVYLASFAAIARSFQVRSIHILPCPEIHKLNERRFIQQYILRLDIPMRYIPLMHFLHSLDNLA